MTAPPVIDQGGFELSTAWEPPAPRRRRWWLWAVLAVLLLLLAAAGVAAGIFVHGANTYAQQYEGRLLPGTVIAGVDVGGKDREEATAAVAAVIAPELERTVTVRWGEREWTAAVADLDSTTDADAAVDEAFEATAAMEWEDLARMRWLGETFAFSRDIAVTHSEEAARAFVDAIAEEVNTDPQDAVLDHSTGWVEIHPSRVGYLTDTAGSAEALFAAVEDGEEGIDLGVHTVAPAVTEEAYRQVLLLRQDEYRVHLYQDGEVSHSWPVAIGDTASGYPTPTGVYEVTLKRYMPTWINPDPTGWGKDMPLRIDPGVTNPLGVRALNWSVGAIRFHGTANVNSIGRSASKGCVRLTNNDVIELYNLVEEGATIVSLRA
jgi:lipoprotein-anchoring transpeptidase ErfK/SrfK